MTPKALTCPYCNAEISVSAATTAGQRIICPRCGDAFALRPGEAFTNQPPTLTETGISSRPAPTSSTAVMRDQSLPPRHSLRLVAALVVGVMLLMAGGGLIFMLKTQEQRRGYDTSRPPRRPGRQRGVPEPDLPPVAAVVSPDKLAALGYLPGDVNLLVGVRVPELLAGPVGGQLARDPLKIAGGSYRLEDLPSWVGFRLDDVDHLVLAARIDDNLLPPFYLVLRTQQPYSAKELGERLKGILEPSASKKTLYKFHPPRPDVEMFAWCADEQTVVLALFADQLERLPNQPVEGLQQLPAEVRTILKERRPPAAPVWIAGHSSDWTKTQAARFLNRLKKDDVAKLASLRSFALWLVPEKELIVKGDFGCENEDGAQRLEEYFRSLRGPDPQFKTALAGRWLSLQFHTGADWLPRLLKR